MTGRLVAARAKVLAVLVELAATVFGRPGRPNRHMRSLSVDVGFLQRLHLVVGCLECSQMAHQEGCDVGALDVA